jgi:hypothetical protein
MVIISPLTIHPVRMARPDESRQNESFGPAFGRAGVNKSISFLVLT